MAGDRQIDVQLIKGNMKKPSVTTFRAVTNGARLCGLFEPCIIHFYMVLVKRTTEM